jgi:energy-coupling factor transport system permease protein
MALGGVRANRTRYRPDPWRGPEWLTVACGLAALVGVVAAARWGISGVAAGTDPIEVPVLPLLPTAVVLLALLPAFATPEPTP